MRNLIDRALENSWTQEITKGGLIRAFCAGTIVVAAAAVLLFVPAIYITLAILYLFT